MQEMSDCSFITSLAMLQLFTIL